MNFSVTILGCNSAIPTATRYPTAQIVNVQENYYLVDCGEGTQIQLRRNKIKFQRIDAIFISHLHGDHFFGLIGLVTTMQLLGRTRPLQIFGPSELEAILNIQLDKSRYGLHFELKFEALDFATSKVIYEDDKVEVKTILLSHSIPCCGFRFQEKERPRKLNKFALDKFEVPMECYGKLKRGEDFVNAEGEIIQNSVLTADPIPARTYAYCSDTSYNEGIIPDIQGVDLLYHEATFLHDMKERAVQTCHSTALEAGMIAAKAAVKRLVIGHYSARYGDLDPLVAEARTAFPETVAGVEGRTYSVPMVEVTPSTSSPS